MTTCIYTECACQTRQQAGLPLSNVIGIIRWHCIQYRPIQVKGIRKICSTPPPTPHQPLQCQDYFQLKHKDVKIFENNLNSDILAFSGKLSTLR